MPVQRVASLVVVGSAAALSGGCGADGASAASPVVRVFAASSTTDALQETLDALAVAGGPRATAVVGSSAALARQIEQGAPADLFLSASPVWMDHLEQGGQVVAGTRIDLLANALVVVATAEGATRSGAPPPTLQPGVDWSTAVGGGAVAVGDPAHVPAGQYAEAALRWAGAWGAVEAQLVPAADARGALSFVERGATPLGIVYQTDARASQDVALAAVFPEDAHPPIVYPLAVVAGREARPGVQAVYAHLQGEDARSAFTQHGFGRP